MHILHTTLGLARTKNLCRVWLYVRWFPCRKYCIYIGLAKTIYIRCTYGIFGLEITKYTVYIYVYIRFWPTLYTWWFPCHKYRIYTVYIWFKPTPVKCFPLSSSKHVGIPKHSKHVGIPKHSKHVGIPKHSKQAACRHCWRFLPACVNDACLCYLCKFQKRRRTLV